MNERILLCLAHMIGRKMDFDKEAFDTSDINTTQLIL